MVGLVTLRLTTELFTGEREEEAVVDVNTDDVNGNAPGDEVRINDVDADVNADADKISVENGSIDDVGTAEVSGVVEVGTDVDTGGYSEVALNSVFDLAKEIEASAGFVLS